MINRIRFEVGAKTAVEEGTVAPPVTIGPDMTNDGVERYTPAARARQYFSIELSSDDQKALFTLVKPSPVGAKTEPVRSAAGVRRWAGGLSPPGDYLLTVFTRGREAPSHFKLRVATR